MWNWKLSAKSLLLGAALLASPISASAAIQARTEHDRYIITSLTYQSAATEAAIKRQYNAQIVSLRQQIGSRDTQLSSLKQRLAGSSAGQNALRAQIDSLEHIVADLKDSFTTSLATRDAEYAREKAAYDAAATNILRTPQGRQALELYITGKQGSAEQAVNILNGIASMRNALDLREVASTIGDDGIAHGRLSTQFVTGMWEKVVQADPNNPFDWIRLANLYKGSSRFADAENAALKAKSLSSGDRTLVLSLTELCDAQLSENNVDRVSNYCDQAQQLVSKALRIDPNDYYALTDHAEILAAKIPILIRKRDFDSLYAINDEISQIRSRMKAAGYNTLYIDNLLLQSKYSISGILLLVEGNSKKSESIGLESLSIANDMELGYPGLISNYLALWLANSMVADARRYNSDRGGEINYYAQALKYFELIPIDSLDNRLLRNGFDQYMRLAYISSNEEEKQVESCKKALYIYEIIKLKEIQDRDFRVGAISCFEGLAKTGSSEFTWDILFSKADEMRALVTLTSEEEKGLRDAKRKRFEK